MVKPHFGSFWVKVTIVWVRDLGARGAPPPNFNLSFGCVKFRLWDPRSRVRPAVGWGEPPLYLIGPKKNDHFVRAAGPPPMGGVGRTQGPHSRLYISGGGGGV